MRTSGDARNVRRKPHEGRGVETDRRYAEEGTSRLEGRVKRRADGSSATKSNVSATKPTFRINQLANRKFWSSEIALGGTEWTNDDLTELSEPGGCTPVTPRASEQSGALLFERAVK